MFKNAADAKDSVKLNGEEFLAKHLRVNFAYKPVQNRECSIFLGSLPYMIKDEELWEEFKEFGEIEYVRVIRDPITFVGKGIGFICFKEKNAAKRAISKNNTFLQGRTIRVSKARDTELDAEPKKNKFNGFSNLKNLKTQADILDTAKMFTTKGTSSLKGTKKLVRKEQNKLQEKRKQRKESNTKTINQAKKPKKKAKLE